MSAGVAVKSQERPPLWSVCRCWSACETRVPWCDLGTLFSAPWIIARPHALALRAVSLARVAASDGGCCCRCRWVGHVVIHIAWSILHASSAADASTRSGSTAVVAIR